MFHTLSLLSFAVPGLLMAMAWIFIFSPNIGWGNAVLKSALGLNEAPVNVYSPPGGPSAGRLEALVAELLDRFPVRAVSLTAYDPEVDRDDRVPPVALRLLELVAEKAQG